MPSTAAEHGGAMADGGEACKMALPWLKSITTASTSCRRARRSWVRLIAGRGGAPAANSTGGAAVALAGERAERVRAEQRGSVREWSGERSGFGR